MNFRAVHSLYRTISHERHNWGEMDGELLYLIQCMNQAKSIEYYTGSENKPCEETSKASVIPAA